MGGVVKGRNIAVAVDTSAIAAGALDWAIENVCTKDDTIVLLHVRPVTATETTSMIPVPACFEEHICSQVQDLMAKFRARCQEAEMNCQTHVATGDAREELVKLLGVLDVTVLVMGCRGLGAVLRNHANSRFKGGFSTQERGPYLGSVSDHVVRFSPVPVLVVRNTNALCSQ